MTSSRGSTAPTITSPLLAWPSQPTPRSSPLSSPSTGEFGHTPLSSLYSSSVVSGSVKSLATTIDMIPRSESWAGPLSKEVSGKGKAREADTVPGMGHSLSAQYLTVDGEWRERRYQAPKRPLSPAQLGRIAQSFGIVVPGLPLPKSASSPPRSSDGRASAASLRRRQASHTVFTRATPYLLAVVPPLALLPPSSATTPAESHQRTKRWKRGRLLALQPTMGAMLLCIAREFGLPSTLGLGLYLVPPTGSRGEHSSSSDESFGTLDEASGPMISSHTWAILFATHLHQNATSRSSSQSHTPFATSGPFQHDMVFPPSPLSLVHEHAARSSKDRMRSFSNQPTPSKVSKHSHHASSSSAMPLTPASMDPPPSSPTFNPVVGTIEFDIDLAQAVWLDDWLRSGGPMRRRGSAVSDGGIRELKLPLKVKNDLSPRFLRDLDPNRPRLPKDDSFASLDEAEDYRGYGTTPDITLDELDPMTGLFSSANAEFGVLRSIKPPGTFTRLSIRHRNAEPIMSVSASLCDLADGDGGPGDEERQIREALELLNPIDEDGDLLASPIELEQVIDLSDGERRKLMATFDKRGSSIVMSEQLADLERIMRQLSPREIRLTSPRMLTPRMAAKVASANLSLPPVPTTNLRSSSLAVPKSAPSPLSATFGDQTRQTAANTENRSEQSKSRPDQGQASSPAVPFSQLSAAPRSPDVDYFSQVDFSSPRLPTPTAISSETLQRSQPVEPKTTATEWKPRRPARPPSPGLQHQRTLSHAMSAELVEHLRSPPLAANSPSSPAEGDSKPKYRNRSGSISLRGLRSQMSSKNLNVVWGRDQKDRTGSIPVLPSSATARDPETVGLFKGPVEAGRSSFTSLGGENQYPKSETLPSRHPERTLESQGSHGTHGPSGIQSINRYPGEFGSLDPLLSSSTQPSSRSVTLPIRRPSHLPAAAAALQPTAAPPADYGSTFASRILHGSFSFVRKSSLTLGQKDKSKDREKEQIKSGNSKRSPSISSPVANTFHRIETGSSPPQSVGSQRGSKPPKADIAPTAPSGDRTIVEGSKQSIPPSGPDSPAQPAGTPQSQASPRSVKRKPVPGFSAGSAAAGEAERGERSQAFMGIDKEDPSRRGGTGMGMAV